MQVIYYGAPGTGKSYEIDHKIIKSVEKNRIFRITFHPDYTYSDFVGQIMPKIISPCTKDEQSTITYDFQKGIFTLALEKAYENTSKDVYLIIEEMSRGNCAAIFGDIFQLLDRENSGVNKGYSRYFIDNELSSKDIVAINDNKVKLPPNFHILGTVNTSDQNVFVMDTAFKRRFEWKYISTTPIKVEDSPNEYKNDIKIVVHTDNEPINTTWVKLYQALNTFITNDSYLALGEDKQLGQFFIEFDLSESQDKHKEQIKNKLLHYLWSDIQKASYKNDKKIFKESIGTFSELYEKYENNFPIFSSNFIEILRKQ